MATPTAQRVRISFHEVVRTIDYFETILEIPTDQDVEAVIDGITEDLDQLRHHRLVECAKAAGVKVIELLHKGQESEDDLELFAIDRNVELAPDKA